MAHVSTTDNTDGRLPLLKHGVYNRLNALGGADAHFVIDGHTDESERLLSASQADDAPNRLGDTDVVHITHKQHCLKSADVDIFRQDAVVKNNKLLVRIFTPGIQSVKEHLTVDFLPVDDSTSLGSDIHAGVTTLGQLFAEVRFCKKFDNLLGRTSTDKNLIQRVLINSVQQVLTIAVSNHLLVLNHIQLLDNNLRRQDITFLNQLRSRNIANDFTVDFYVIHPRFGNSERMLRSSSEEIAAVSASREVLRSRKEVTLNRIVRFIEINGIDFNICLLQTMQRMIGGEDDYILTSSPCSVDEQVNLTRVSGRKVMSLTTMNVKNMSIGSVNVLQKLRAQLFCQQNTRSNNNSSHTVVDILAVDNHIVEHNWGFTTASGDDNLPLVKCQHGIQSILLVGSELHHFLIAYETIIAENRP